MDKIELTIDGQPVQAEKGMTVLEAAQKAGIYIPTLCADDNLEPFGACRLCIVEIDKVRGLPTACTIPAADGMTVRTSSPQIDRIRRNIVELLLSDHPSDCLTCPQNNRCELQILAAYVGVRQMRFKGEKRAYPLDDSNPFFVRDLERCILCGKCVRVCDEIQGRHAIYYAYRGLESKIATVLDRPLAQSNCESCGQCVDKCPVGALYPKASMQYGFPTRETVTTCTYCGVGCSIILETRNNQIIGARGDPSGAANRGQICVKGHFGYEFVNHRDRLTKPLIKKDGAFIESSWDEALDLIADKFTQIKADHDDNAGGSPFGVLTSAKCTNEENYLAQKFTRAILGTNSVDHCARL
ncbi:MAG: (2Fe-2S)-binding protein [Anaerolineae bacterium]|nr:(2Fe-2S)-binding protein [Anaerolineae bacterium]